MTNPMIPGPLRSRLYECRVMHHRLSPKEHRFEYGLFLACVDLDELDAIQQQLRFFSHNRRNLYELRESDHFIHPPAAPEAPASGGLNPDSAVRLSADGADGADAQEEMPGFDRGKGLTSRVQGHLGSIPFVSASSAQSADTTAVSGLKARVVSWLGHQGVAPEQIGRIELVTLPRVAGYVFNPVSFYFVSAPDGSPVCAIAEVGNTFGEQKPFFVPRRDRASVASSDSASAEQFRLVAPKHFYVSPFSALDLQFDFRLARPGERLSLGVNDVDSTGKTVLISSLTGTRRPLTDRELLRLTARYPLVTARVITLIHWQALRLWLKRIPFFSKAAQPELQRGVLHRSPAPTGHR